MQAVRNIFWWLCFVALGICVQSLVPCLDALVVGLVILLQERDYKTFAGCCRSSSCCRKA